MNILSIEGNLENLHNFSHSQIGDSIFTTQWNLQLKWRELRDVNLSNWENHLNQSSIGSDQFQYVIDLSVDA